MKKFIFLIISLVIFPLSAFAVNYDIKHYYIDASILSNGDIAVNEYIALKGTYNGYVRDILYKGNYDSNRNASDITNIYVYGASNVTDNIDIFDYDYPAFTKVYSATSGEVQKYTLSNITNGYSITMFNKTTSSTTIFKISYLVKDAAIMHGDVTEVYWNFIGSSFADDLNDVKLRVTLPSNTNKDAINWWFHGPLSGSSDMINNNQIEANVDNVDAYTAVDFRVLLPNDMFNKSLFKKIDNEIVKEAIIAEEDKIVEQDLANIKKVRTIYYAIVASTWIYYAFVVIAFIYTYIKYDKERKSNFVNKYNREFIDDYNVEVIDYLMNKNITPNAMSASIMNLIYKKNITFKEVAANKKNYEFTLVNKDNINGAEGYLIDFLFTTVGSNNTFTTEELKSYARSSRTCDVFMSSYTKWKNKVISDGKSEAFFEEDISNKNKNVKVIIAILFTLIALAIIFITGSYSVDYPFAYGTIVASIIYTIYMATVSKKTEKGIEHYTKWKAFKNFLNDFGRFDLKELPEVVLWERYLVYATIFGLASKVRSAMNVRIEELNLTDEYTPIFIYNNVDIAPVISNTITNAYSGAQTAINRANANASGGSFGGHGGGFSSGGGFGGGGGGGHGF